MRSRRATLAAPVLLTALATGLATACAPVEDEGSDTAADTSADTSGAASPDADPAACVEGAPLVQDGRLTIGTDSPAFEPWFVDNDPTNGEGYEAAVAYAVAEELGFSEDQVAWVTVPFNSSYAPGAKKFDFDINQISITPDRAKVVDFSEGYYQASQAVITLEDSPLAGLSSIADLADHKLGAQTGTTSLTAIRDVIEPDEDPLVFEDTNAAKQALKNGQVEAILADLPTAFYISAVEIPGSTIIGQFQPETGEQEEFGMLFEKGNPLRECVDAALANLREDGTLAEIEQQWLSDTVSVPTLD
ncbi:transporter substrate-binding domain-containing protein [Nocardioides marmotae]|uniref:Transporter substrate-binding domain-containing protein n=1 Tax=Nocardioides marmotae TaxID=2663857 RepID=A0A6I3JHC1_9ACTN|nr:transporter substrate-binding domain-containing protein [Nocardioides marmotae]MCR6033822.1 transporter substrate-binding domain-containing protein [Gordonia jinghuaiqii]MBC9732489.1 amino acid ABC transporter substrate-binding protein [Nocardioides marmotae]MTB83608.1 transporter substrate-binding domain-containing protein [Nocardioides marmotae]MTB97480.1 transporter substrate-binding domain-containing protein [Nocardioides marmotae]QKE03139.1 amino acid ABC transporter substrate-binding 